MGLIDGASGLEKMKPQITRQAFWLARQNRSGRTFRGQGVETRWINRAAPFQRAIDSVRLISVMRVETDLPLSGHADDQRFLRCDHPYVLG